MKNTIHKIIFIVLLAFAVLDVFNISNGILRVAGGLASCLAAFYLGTSHFVLKKRNGIEVFSITFLVLLVTARYKVYFFTIFILSALLWMAITPRLIKYKRFFSITVIIAFFAAYVFPLLGIQIALFPIVIYPVYVLGYKTGGRSLWQGEGKWKKLLFNIFFASFTALFLRSKAGQVAVEADVLFIRPASGATAALYLPWIVIFYLIAVAGISMLVYYFTTVSREGEGVKEEVAAGIEGLQEGVDSFIRLFVFLCILLFIGEYTLQGSWRDVWEAIAAPQGMMNLMFLAAVCITLEALLGRGLSMVLLSVVTLLLAVSNSIKIKFFNEPFYPWDIYIIKNALLISKRYIDFKLIALGVALAAAAVVLIVRCRGILKRKLAFQPAFVLLVPAACMIMANAGILASPGHLYELNMGKSWYVGMGEMKDNGVFVQNFFYLTELGEYLNTPPEGYSYDKMMEIKETLRSNEDKTGTEEKPNIILVMSETFWDPTKLEGVSFTKDITENLKKYQKGEIVSPIFGGGTANAEFEALTGMSTFFMNPGIIPYNVYLRRDTPSIVSVLRDNGYGTTAIHPNTGEFYNRNTVYKHFGFDEFIDIGGFSAQDVKGNNVSDESLVNKILEVLNSKSEEGKPQFIFAVTMQNHDPYYDVYDDLEVYAESDKLDEVETSILSNYAQGIYDADRSLGKLIDAVGTLDTPTVVYFFGDHLPRLGSPRGIYDIYNKLDFFSDLDNIQTDIRLYETPLAIWANYKATEDFVTPVSPAHIASAVLNDSQVDWPEYFNILDELREMFPVLQSHVTEKECLEDELLQLYRMIQYDLLFGKQYLNSNA